METHQCSITELRRRLKAKEVSVREVCQSYLDRIDRVDPQLNSLIQTNPYLLNQADALDSKGDRDLPLFGVPVAVKDNFCVRGMKATAGSKILENFSPPYSAHCIERLQKAGAIILGKTNLDEFGMGSSNENSASGVCRNPWNTQHVPGGSSGGSAAAMAARLAAITIGSDTGGSIRQPASFCGVVGLKPTYGSVSRSGMIAYASSLDQAGCFGKTVQDVCEVIDTMVGRDPNDGTNVERQQGRLNNVSPLDLKNLRIGLPAEYFGGALAPGTKTVIEKALQLLEQAGCEVKTIHLPHTEHAVPAYYLIAGSEASSNLARYDGVRFGVRDVEVVGAPAVSELDEFYKRTRTRGFGEEVKRRILLGTFSLSAGHQDAYFKKSCQIRRLISEDFFKAFSDCDLILGPVTTDSAFALGEKVSDPIAMYYNDIFTTPANLAGLPALSLPAGIDEKGLPVGIQVIGPAFTEEKLLGFALSAESLFDFREVPDVI